MCRIGGRHRSRDASLCGASLEIPPFALLMSNRGPLSGSGTLHGGEFDWGGRLLNSNGGARWLAQTGRKSVVECNGRSQPDCKSDKTSRDESRS
jgi:hypothetical protein